MNVNRTYALSLLRQYTYSMFMNLISYYNKYDDEAHEANYFHTTNLQKDAQINHIYKVIHMCSYIVNTCNEIKSIKLLNIPMSTRLKTNKAYVSFKQTS